MHERGRPSAQETRRGAALQWREATAEDCTQRGGGRDSHARDPAVLTRGLNLKRSKTSDVPKRIGMTLDGKRHHQNSKISLSESCFSSYRLMAVLASKGPLVSLGEVLLAGETLRCVGSCIPGQGPRAGKNAIFATAVLRHPIDTAGEAECKWYIEELKPNSGICLGMSTLGVHAAAAEDWAGVGKTGRVWYVILRGSEPKGRAGGGAFMDGGNVISACSALFGYRCFSRRRVCAHHAAAVMQVLLPCGFYLLFYHRACTHPARPIRFLSES